MNLVSRWEEDFMYWLNFFLYFSYKLNNLDDGNFLDVSLRVEVCFDDGGLCVVNFLIFINVMILKWNKEWFL